MEEGSLRCDVNISVRKTGDPELGTKVEVKNLNSIRNVKLAVETEAKRLVDLLEKGGTVIQETRSFDAGKGTTFATREKEDADDYRYFAEPDLTPFQIRDEFIVKIRKTIPVLAGERIKRYTTGLQLSEYDAGILTEEKTFSDYYETLLRCLDSWERSSKGRPKAAANWMLGPVRSWMNENNNEIGAFPISPATLASVIGMVEEGKISFSAASTKLFSRLVKEPGKDPEEVAVEENLLQQSDVAAIEPIIDKVLEKFAGKVTEYKKGKKGLLALFVGEVMKQSKGKADPKLTSQLVEEKLKS
jgi:aspartyl-tRNA(Asn)/glutamyl-tRNA(Gln) amidotransferase subunit B